MPYLYNKDLSTKLDHLRHGKFFYPFRKDHIVQFPSVPSKSDTSEWLLFGIYFDSPFQISVSANCL